MNLLLDLAQMAATLNFSTTIQCLNIFRQHHCVRYTLKPYNRTQKYESASIVLKMISIYCLTLNKWRPSWILPTMQCQKLLLTTPLDRAYMKTKIIKLLIFCRKLCQFFFFNFLRSLKDIFLISCRYSL